MYSAPKRKAACGRTKVEVARSDCPTFPPPRLDLADLSGPARNIVSDRPGTNCGETAGPAFSPIGRTHPRTLHWSPPETMKMNRFGAADCLQKAFCRGHHNQNCPKDPFGDE